MLPLAWLRRREGRSPDHRLSHASGFAISFDLLICACGRRLWGRRSAAGAVRTCRHLKAGTAPTLKPASFVPAPCPTPCGARMREQYRTGSEVRPLRRGCADFDEAGTGRFFLCARCRAQVLICSHCDRGHRYCAEGCAWEARRRSQREAGRRYGRSRDGRFACAERNRRYRARRKNVTHQGSPRHPWDGVLVVTSAVVANKPVTSGWQCQWCGRRCADSVRLGTLRNRQVRRHNRKGPEHDHPP